MNETSNITIPGRRSTGWFIRAGVGGGALLLIGLLYTGWRWYTAPNRIAAAMIEASQPNGELKSRLGQVEGTATLESDQHVQRIKYVTDLPAAPAKHTYHGWLYDPASRQYRYAGQFYPYEDTRQALIFTTEEDIHTFNGLVVSSETTDAPASPTTIVAAGLLPAAE